MEDFNVNRDDPTEWCSRFKTQCVAQNKTADADILHEFDKYSTGAVQMWARTYRRQNGSATWDQFTLALKQIVQAFTTTSFNEDLVFRPGDDIVNYIYSKVDAITANDPTIAHDALERKVVAGLPEEIADQVHPSVDLKQMTRNIVLANKRYANGLARNVFAISNTKKIPYKEEEEWVECWVCKGTGRRGD